jgi:DNA-binding transcriptional regulator YbjK
VPSVTPPSAGTDPAPSGRPSARRGELLDAAVLVVADEGLRGLTHRAVDRRAGLGEGTCSAYFRTRQALQVAVAEHLGVSLTSDVDRLGAELAECAGEGPDRALTLTLALFERWLEERTRVLARLELSMEGSRNPAVAQVQASSRARLIALVEQILTNAGKPHSAVRAETLVSAFDGLLIAALHKPVRQRRTFLAESLALVLGGVTGTT